MPISFARLRARAKSETDPASKRRYLHALARVEEGPLPALALTDDIAMRDCGPALDGGAVDRLQA